MGLVDVLPRRAGRAPFRGKTGMLDVAVLEDEPHLAELAVQVCGGLGLRAEPYRTPTDLLAAFDGTPPRAVILDWRLEREMSSAVFMALRHRFPDVPIVCWTGLPVSQLPAMVAADRRTQLVQKATGLDAFEAAIRRAASSGTKGDSTT